MRIGFSKDIHRLVEGKRLVVGGVYLPFERGCLAHSDGDVVYHALGEAILGALALGDLGKHFPTNDPSLDGINSSIILKRIYDMMVEHDHHIINADLQIVLERPKLKDHIMTIRNNIANILNCDVNQISVKAGTNEGCGEIGKSEAVECSAIVLLEQNKN